MYLYVVYNMWALICMLCFGSQDHNTLSVTMCHNIIIIINWLQKTHKSSNIKVVPLKYTLWEHSGTCYPVMMDLLEVFVDGVVAWHHGNSRERQVEHHQGQHVGHIVPVQYEDNIDNDKHLTCYYRMDANMHSVSFLYLYNSTCLLWCSPMCSKSSWAQSHRRPIPLEEQQPRR